MTAAIPVKKQVRLILRKSDQELTGTKLPKDLCEDNYPTRCRSVLHGNTSNCLQNRNEAYKNWLEEYRKSVNWCNVKEERIKVLNPYERCSKNCSTFVVEDANNMHLQVWAPFKRLRRHSSFTEFASWYTLTECREEIKQSEKFSSGNKIICQRIPRRFWWMWCSRSRCFVSNLCCLWAQICVMLLTIRAQKNKEGVW